MEQGSRFNVGKPKWSLVPQTALLPMVEVLEFGAQKYSAHNWKRGLPITEICESLKRHLDAFLEGEDNDPESGISHIGHMQCNTLFLSYMFNKRPDLDDRHKEIVDEKDLTRIVFDDMTNAAIEARNIARSIQSLKTNLRKSEVSEGQINKILAQ